MAEVSHQIRDMMIELARKTPLPGLARRIAPERYQNWKRYYFFKAKVKKGHVLVDEHELEREYRKAVRWLVDHVGRDAISDYLEFGVYYGTSLACMHRVLEAYGLKQTRLFGFDSFDGLPEVVHPDDHHWHQGQFKSNYKFAREFLGKQGVDWGRVFLVKGWFSDTLNEDFIRTYNVRKASLIMVDCDMYQSAKEALDFCAPLIQDHAIVFFDDWNAMQLAEENQGEKRAFEEFLSENPHLTAEEFSSYTCMSKPNGKVFRVSVKS